MLAQQLITAQPCAHDHESSLPKRQMVQAFSWGQKEVVATDTKSTHFELHLSAYKRNMALPNYTERSLVDFHSGLSCIT